MKKILILTASFGDGHNAAARNLRDAIELVDEDARAETVDLFADSYGAFNTLAKKTYLGMVAYAPRLWGQFFSLLENPIVEKQLGGFTRLQNTLEKVLAESQPDCVVSTYPIYGHVIKKIYASHHERPFKFITVVTDSISINTAWFRAPSDYFCVANEATAEVLAKGGILEQQIKVTGFPVSPIFADSSNDLPQPIGDEPRRVLYVINTGKKKAGKAIDRLLEIDDVHLTITAGRDPELRAKLIERTKDQEHRVKILGWTNQMPELMLSHHLIIGKAGGATVQEAIAARCPMIINQVIPGQEEGNAELIEKFNLGAVVEKNKEVAEAVEMAFEKRATLWNEWRKNLKKISRPDAARKIAELILDESECDFPGGKAVKLFETSPSRLMRQAQPATSNGGSGGGGSSAQMLLCDFHIHTNYSDGKLSVPEIIDFYGERGFDCICITDHLADPSRLLGKLAELANCTLAQEQVGEYFAIIERERQRAWRRYKMLVMTGIEFNKDGYTKKTSAHLLGIDLKSPISASFDIPEIIEKIHEQGGLAVASHPHIMKSEWGKNTLYLWENQDKFAPLLDAWEIANRNNIFNDVGLKRLPFIANSDFHKPKHIYSWKTLIHAEKDPEAIKDCVRRNEHVAITLYRDFAASAKGAKHGFESSAVVPSLFEERLSLQVVNH
ncbi:MAG TPA: PHP domain-containing protein [Verrucomicrobiae bacterium]|jgi:UDP-N-acetylglucosamine:LPS N-acetylglucosamine transferase/predicted metal-dependent phosphoesterase TrpH|nr:PHP domain-containing protein [Verrucomicrobiae bacterium]